MVFNLVKYVSTVLPMSKMSVDICKNVKMCMQVPACMCLFSTPDICYFCDITSTPGINMEDI